MLVYRVCSQDEINKIFQNDDFSAIGCLGENFIKYQKIRDINNHKYDPKKLYLHFFEDVWSIIYWKANKNNFICTYDIPDDILVDCFGIGKYLNPNSESDNQSCITEYAIESNKIKKDYLTRVELITDDMDFTDDDYPEVLDDYLIIIYEREPKKYQYRMKKISDEEIQQVLKNLKNNKQKLLRNLNNK